MPGSFLSRPREPGPRCLESTAPQRLGRTPSGPGRIAAADWTPTWPPGSNDVHRHRCVVAGIDPRLPPNADLTAPRCGDGVAEGVIEPPASILETSASLIRPPGVWSLAITPMG